MEEIQEQIEQARALERAEQFQGALDLYARLSEESGPHEADPAFWVRLGDLHGRAGDTLAGVEALERAAELCAEAGLGNAALALYRRVLRIAPDRPGTLLRLGETAAREGYAREAREGYVGYAERMGDHESSLEALRDHLAAFPEDTSVRRLLADRLRARGDEDGAVRELRSAWSLLQRAGAGEGAEEVRSEILAMRPDADPEVGPVEEPPLASGAEDEALSGGERAGAAERDPAFQATSLPSVEPASEIAPLEGLEPTHADLGRSEPPDADDLPLIGNEPAGSDAEPAAEAEAEEEEALPLLGTMPAAEEPPAAQVRPLPPERPQAERRMPAPPRDDYVDLGALILGDDDEGTRFRVAAGEPSGDEDKDFEEILRLFRQQLSQHIDPGDVSSHYDLGVAFKEMGLLDDAIAQFQAALRGGANPLATLEVLGESFVEKGEYSLAARVLERATKLRAVSEPDLVGVHYWLGRCEEELGRPAEAQGCYERVVAVDMTFRDAAARLDLLRSGSAGSL